MGLGFFIAKTLLERSGARLELANRPRPLRRRRGHRDLAAGEIRAGAEAWLEFSAGPLLTGRYLNS